VLGIGAQLEGRLDPHIAPRRAVAAQPDLFGLLQLARQQPAVHALPGVVIRERGDLHRPRADRPQPVQTLVAAQEEPVVRRSVIHLAVHHRHGIDGDLRAGRVELKPDIPGLALDQRRDETPGTRHGVGLMPVDIPRQHRQIKRLAEVTGAGRPREAAGFRETVRMTRIGQPHDRQPLLRGHGEDRIAADALPPEIEDHHWLGAADRVSQPAARAVLGQQTLSPLHRPLAAHGADRIHPVGGGRQGV